jgi:hypothetical protein
MANQISIEAFPAGLLIVLDETFENVHGIYLDRNTSLFETLATISAAEASRPVGDGCATLAAQVNHTRFYLDTIMQLGRGEISGKVDWASSWQVGAVSEPEWQELIEQLRGAYAETKSFAGTFEAWDEDFIGGAFGIVAHCAYHLGEIRQALCLIKGGRTIAT